MNKSAAALLLAVLALLFFRAAHTGAGQGGALLPIGASYQEDTLVQFSYTALDQDSDNTVLIRVLPITYASNPTSISQAERADNLALAQSRAGQVEDACELAAGQGVICEAAAVDIQVRGDAENAALVGQLTGGDVDGVFILGGDQTIAMQVAANTLLEDVLETLSAEGVPIGGTSAGAAVQSRYMIGGYTGNNYAWDALKLGAVDLWYGSLDGDHRGLRFGLDEVVIEQHMLERGRLARLLQAVEQLPFGDLGLGVDWGTGVRVEPGAIITGTFGAYTAVVLDAGAFGASDGAQYVGSDQFLSIHRVALHLLPPGGYGYDLAARQPVFGGIPLPAPDPDLLPPLLGGAPEGHGALYLCGDLGGSSTGPVVQAFTADAQAAGGTTVVFSAGYATDNGAVQAADFWKGRLEAQGALSVTGYALTSGSDLSEIAGALDAAGSIFMIGGQHDVMAGQIQSMVDSGIGAALGAAWARGAPVLLDNAAASAAGEWMTAAAPPSDVEIEASDSFLSGQVPISQGFGLLPGAVFEPRVFYDYLYGRLFSHVVAEPGAPAFGIARGTAIRIGPDAAGVIGDGPVLVVDGRSAAYLGAGQNSAFAAAWILLDTFAPGESLPVNGGEPTPTPSPTGSNTHTATPGPSSTPQTTPSPTSSPAVTPSPTPLLTESIYLPLLFSEN